MEASAAIAPGYVLIVDDDDDILFIMAMLLTDEGFEVQTANNGQQALEAIQARMPRLILLDLKMPVMNGWEFVGRFRELYQHATPIVVMSAIDDIGRRATEIDVDDWLAKPFEAAALADMVRRHTSETASHGRGGGDHAVLAPVT